MHKLPVVLEDGRLEQGFKDKKPLYSAVEAIAEAERCLYCSDAPCVKACPTAIDIPTFIKKIASGNVQGSAKTILSQNLLGYSCARVCPVEVLCAGSCVYETWGREPIAIGRLQRYATEAFHQSGENLLPAQPKKTGAAMKKAVCIGAGPASLAFAGTLALAGYDVKILEKRKVPGGLNATGIAPYKLKSADAVSEVEYVASLGVAFELGVEVDGPGGPSAKDLLAQYDAVFVGVGLGPDSKLGAPGEDGPGVIGAIDWIEEMKLKKGAPAPLGHVLVIGGGNTAIDAAREAAGLGATEVAMVYRRGKADMSGYAHEMDGARKESVRLIEHAIVSAFVRDASGKLVAAKLVKAQDGKPVAGSEWEVPCDLAVLAIGQSKLKEIAKNLDGVAIDKRGCVVVDDTTRQTGNPKVFAGGDCVNGGKEVVNGVADGRDAARFLIAKWGA